MISCKTITQKQIVVALQTWRPLHSVLFSALVEYSTAIYSDRFNDLINLGLISPDEASNFFSDFTSDKRVFKLSSHSETSQHHHWYQNSVWETELWTVPKNMCFETFLFNLDTEVFECLTWGMIKELSLKNYCYLGTLKVYYLFPYVKAPNWQETWKG